MALEGMKRETLRVWILDSMINLTVNSVINMMSLLAKQSMFDSSNDSFESLKMDIKSLDP